MEERNDQIQSTDQCHGEIAFLNNDTAGGRGMTDFFLHGARVDTVFHLLGNNENAITKSLGWCLSQVPSFLDSLGRELGTSNLSAHGAVVKLQEYQSETGITDLEIHAGGYPVWIVEAKLGFTVPSVDQLKRYAGRLAALKDSKAQCGLVALAASDRSNRWLSRQLQELQEQLCEIPIRALSWRRIQHMAESARCDTSHANKRLLAQFQTYLEMEVSMRNWNDNQVHVAPLNHSTFGGSTSFVDVVEKYRKYFHPVDGKLPKEPPNYLGFRYDGYLKSIHHVEGYEIVTDVGPYFPEQPNEEWDRPHWLFDLGPPIRPPNDMRVGKNLRAAHLRCAIDLLLTCDTLAAALDAKKKREQRMWSAESVGRTSEA